MSEVNLPENYPDIVVCAAPPFQQIDPSEVRELAKKYTSDGALAAIYAAVSARTTCIGHLVDDPENDAETNERIIVEFEAWDELENELLSKILLRIKNDDGHLYPKPKTQKTGTHYIIKPFMEQNGYRDATGWWVEKK